jgi:hypothetical protein
LHEIEEKLGKTIRFCSGSCGNFRKFRKQKQFPYNMQIQGGFPGWGKVGGFGTQAVITYKRIKTDNFGTVPGIPGKIPGQIEQFQKSGNFDKKKTVFCRIRSAVVPSGNSRSVLVFFGTHNAQNLVKKNVKKSVQILKKHPKTPRNLSGFFAIHSCTDLLSVEAVEIWKIPRAPTAPFFPQNSGGKIGVFGLSTKSEERPRRKSGVATRFLKKKTFFYRFAGWRSMVPRLHEAKIRISIFLKIRYR